MEILLIVGSLFEVVYIVADSVCPIWIKYLSLNKMIQLFIQTFH